MRAGRTARRRATCSRPRRAGRPGGGERVRAHRAVDEHGEADEAEDEQRDRRGAAGLRHHRDQRGLGQRERAEPEHADRQHGLQDRAAGRSGAAGAAPGSAVSASSAAPTGSEAPPASGDHAVHPDDHARRGEAVDGEQRGRRGERGAEQDRAAVTRPHAGDREPGRDDRGGAGGDEHRPEVRLGSAVTVCRRRRHHEQGHGRGSGREEVPGPTGCAICRASHGYRPFGPTLSNTSVLSRRPPAGAASRRASRAGASR